jgi:hypothetical protein
LEVGCGLGLGLGGGLEGGEAVEGLAVLAVAASLEAEDEHEGEKGLAGLFLEGRGEVGGEVWVLDEGFDSGRVAVAEEVEGGGFVGADAVEAPAGGGEVVDEVEFNGVGGLEVVEVGVFEGLEALAGLVVQEDGLDGGTAVADGVAGRAGPALVDSGAGRFRGVGLISGELARRNGHKAILQWQDKVEELPRGGGGIGK